MLNYDARPPARRALNTFQGGPTCPFRIWNTSSSRPRISRPPKTGTSRFSASASGPAPDFKFPVYWLYLGDRDVLHITTGGKNVSENRKKYVGQQSDASTGTGVIDHIGFRTTGLHEMIEHLTKNKIDFNERQVDDQGLYQLSCSIRTA